MQRGRPVQRQKMRVIGIKVVAVEGNEPSGCADLDVRCARKRVKVTAKILEA